MHIISYGPSHSSKKVEQIKKLLRIFWILTAIMLFCYLIYVAVFYKGGNWLLAITLTFLIFIFAIKNKHLKYLKKSLNNYLKGDIGEAMVISELMSRLDNSYTYITNYSNQEVCSGDIDGILLCQRGMFLIEVKNWYGRYRFFGMDVYKHVLSKFYPFKSPIKQLGINNEKITQYLQEKGIGVNPRPFVVFVNSDIEQINGKTGIFITNQKKIADKIFTSPNQNLSSAEIDKILKALEINKLCN